MHHGKEFEIKGKMFHQHTICGIFERRRPNQFHATLRISHTQVEQPPRQVVVQRAKNPPPQRIGNLRRWMEFTPRNDICAGAFGHIAKGGQCRRIQIQITIQQQHPRMLHTCRPTQERRPLAAILRKVDWLHRRQLRRQRTQFRRRPIRAAIVHGNELVRETLRREKRIQTTQIRRQTPR